MLLSFAVVPPTIPVEALLLRLGLGVLVSVLVLRLGEPTLALLLGEPVLLRLGVLVQLLFLDLAPGLEPAAVRLGPSIGNYSIADPDWIFWQSMNGPPSSPKTTSTVLS